MTSSDEQYALPEYEGNPFISKLPPILSPQRAFKILACPPDFSESERNYPVHLRLHCLYRLRRCFIPLEHHLNLESAFSAMLKQGYVTRNPLNPQYITSLLDGHERIIHRNINAVRNNTITSGGGFTLLGTSGGGKSTAVQRILNYYPQVIEHVDPFALQQVVWLKLDCPYQGSAKQLCISFFQQMDNILNTNFLARHGKSRNPVDLMMAEMSQIATRHALGVLVIDEIQHLTLAKGPGSDALLNFLVTLINTIGIPIMLVGTMAAYNVIQKDFRQARRANGIGCAIWDRLPNGPTWKHLVESLWKYQWTKEATPLTDELCEVLYDETQGVVDVLIKLFMLTQKRAMEIGTTGRNSKERIDAGLIRKVANENLKIISPMISALRSGNKALIAQYSDLYFPESTFDEMFRHSKVSTDDLNLSYDSNKEHRQADSNMLRSQLESLGVAEDVAKCVAESICRKYPNESILKLVELSITVLSAGDRGNNTSIKASPKKKTASHSEMLEISKEAKKEYQTVHAELKRKGVVRGPRLDSTG